MSGFWCGVGDDAGKLRAVDDGAVAPVPYYDPALTPALASAPSLSPSPLKLSVITVISPINRLARAAPLTLFDPTLRLISSPPIPLQSCMNDSQLAERERERDSPSDGWLCVCPTMWLSSNRSPLPRYTSSHPLLFRAHADLAEVLVRARSSPISVAIPQLRLRTRIQAGVAARATRNSTNDSLGTTDTRCTFALSRH